MTTKLQVLEETLPAASFTTIFTVCLTGLSVELLGTGWLKALKLGGYAPRRTGMPRSLQQALFTRREDTI